SESYRSFWRAHPAFTENWSDAIEAYVDYDLVGVPPSMHSASVLEAVAADALELNDAQAARAQLAALRSLRGTIPFLRAPRDLLDRPGGLYSPEATQRWQAELPNLVVHEIPGLNHYSIIMTPSGAAPVAAFVKEVLLSNPQQWQRSPA
ncbi:MAG: alpha/beta hydrolase, partial [Salinibacterium sp.]|nr:alpha/beta hydrolase [Salinibacterium sp.]